MRTMVAMEQRSDQADVVVWGGGTGGAAAAIQAARSGAPTLLLTPGSWLGGMVSAAGVCCPDGNELTPWQTGLWGAFLRELQHQEPEGLDHNWVSCFGYRPATAEAILQRWVGQLPLLRWWPNCAMRAVERQGPRIEAVVVEQQHQLCRVSLQVLIDGSDRGDLLPLAEEPFRLGWEAQEEWNEPSAPSLERLGNDPFFRRQPVQSPTWVVMGQLRTQAAQPGVEIPDSPSLRDPFAGASDTFGLERTITYGRLPGGLVMLNWPLHGNDWHDGLERAFSADSSAQAALAAAMQTHSLAFAQALEEASHGWLGLGNAFPAGAGSPHACMAAMPYWREGRRLRGLHVVIEQNLLPQASGAALAPLPLDDRGAIQSIAVGNYANDHHYPGPDWPLAPKSCRWGGRWSGTPFCIPYAALISSTSENLLAADKAFSTSHMANGATRLQPLILNIGQAAGAAAALAIREGLLPAELPVRQLQETLISDPIAPAGPIPLWDTPWHHPEWAIRQRAALKDPTQITIAGHLRHSSADLDPTGAPEEPGERLWQGQLQPDGEGGYTLELAPAETAERRLWPLITLEPALHTWLQHQVHAQTVRLVGTANPWGPWLRVSRLVS
ncbi:MAG: FAD-dependent oxidoreductase [Cyanobacteriota bacterium]|nr:FAD-dependent oxidoreductase [Cyanobacteriota bacterium]